MGLIHILTKLTYVFKTTKVSSANLNDIQDAVIELQDQWTDPAEVGDLTNLTTQDKNSVVGAINEVDAAAKANALDITALQNGLAGLQDSVNDNTADAYSSSSTYKVGQLCIYNNTLYRCTTAITTAEEWTAAHWTATTIAAEIENRVLWLTGVTVSATTGSIVSVSDSRITTDHVLASCTWASDSSITALTSWSTETAGQLTITGTCSAATTADILLVKKNN